MEQTAKNKLLIIVYAALVGVVTFLLMERQKELWEKSAVILFAVILVLLHIKNINRIKYYTLHNDVLITRQTFSKQKEYSLKSVLFWTENHYNLMGIKTGREIVLKLNGGTKINLFEKNSKNFEKLSNYLNENIPEAFKK
ncbi:hypothetical protein [Flavobacterium reichenbachii]|uniref:Uncharacterized protein n=1 Tax=Flavobacterium reichenbachii TaxID=362418 RepID=A0A085ZJM0_9FLAO|nr:hypothetical protein [Flavobacterium reichenbachii]KFF04634.1 hypothetical protein IW19_03395 [Flavobacterium reichenbachii]OXB09829.1 hypothetical protein B0A68_23085 [Flavobacterium reichenbachii]